MTEPTDSTQILERTLLRELKRLEERSQKNELLLPDVNKLTKLSKELLNIREDRRKEKYLEIRLQQMARDPKFAAGDFRNNYDSSPLSPEEEAQLNPDLV